VKLTENDLIFLKTLKQLLEHKDLRVEHHPGYLRLRHNYGEHIESSFRMTRQGVRWRFQRAMDMYISAFQTILTIERILGTEVRDLAVKVSRERHEQSHGHNAQFRDMEHGRDPDG